MPPVGYRSAAKMVPVLAAHFLALNAGAGKERGARPYGSGLALGRPQNPKNVHVTGRGGAGDERGSTGNLRSLFRSIDAPPPGCIQLELPPFNRTQIGLREYMR
jgi:hypothetical protein